MKKIIVVLQICLCINILSVVSGCGQPEYSGVTENGKNNAAGELTERETAEPENIICHVEKDVKLNNETDEKVSHIKLCSGENNSNPAILIDDFSVPFPDGDKVVYENFNYAEIETADLDADGMNEIIIIFSGGAGGTFQTFRVLRNDGVHWKWLGLPYDDFDKSFVTVSLENDEEIAIASEYTDFNETIKLDNGVAQTSGLGYKSIEIGKDKLTVKQYIYVNNTGDIIGAVEQDFLIDSKKGMFAFGETRYTFVSED